METAKQGIAVVTVLLSGIAVEVILAFAKGEQLNLVRLGTLLGIIVTMLLVFLLARQQEASLRVVVAGMLFFLGVAAVVIGLLLVLVVPVTNKVWTNVFGTAIVSAGVLVFLAGVYVVRQRKAVQVDAATEYTAVEPNLSTALFGGGSPALLTTYIGYGQPMEGVVNICGQMLDIRDLQYVAYFTRATCRFCVDVLGDPRVAGMVGEVGPEERRQHYEAFGRLTHDLVKMLNRKLEDVDSGHLIRVVLDVQKGALFYFRIEEDRFLFGVTMNQEKVLETDAKMLRLIDRVGEELGHRPNPDFDRWDDDNVRPFPPRPKNGQAS
jgi:hypothetical protein